jgi:hypothetical protein
VAQLKQELDHLQMRIDEADWRERSLLTTGGDAWHRTDYGDCNHRHVLVCSCGVSHIELFGAMTVPQFNIDEGVPSLARKVGGNQYSLGFRYGSNESNSRNYAARTESAK